MRIIKAGTQQFNKFITGLRLREQADYTAIDKSVSEIICNVRENGNRALIDYAMQFDGVRLDDLKVDKEEIQQAINSVGEKFIGILKSSAENIKSYHIKQCSESWSYKPKEGVTLGQLVRPLERVGIYVPGGKAAYPSTVLMCAIPAQVAGVKSIAMATPCGKDGKVNDYVLAAAGILGIDEIYKMGGAQAIGALAYGTETISPVDKIAGPGNIYVARAKKQVYGRVGIDMIAGPSEICIIGDEKSSPVYVAADLMSQAEHDEMASAVLVTCSETLAFKVMDQIKQQLERLERKNIIEKSLQDNGAVIIVNSLKEAFSVASRLAPEHLEVMLDNAEDYVGLIGNAGVVFLGQHSPEPLGDYFAGPDHTLPTDGTARFASPLGVYDFMKKTSIISYSRERLLDAADCIEAFAEKEGLTAHANSIRVRR